MEPGGGARRSTRAENPVFEIEPVHFDQKELWIVLADFYTNPPKDLRAHLGSIHVSASCQKADGVQLLEQVTPDPTNALARHDLPVRACKRLLRT